MAIALIASTSAGTAQNGGTISAIDTTGANLIVVALSSYDVAAALTDSKGNTWTALTTRAVGGGSVVRMFYCASPVVGTGHTFTASGANTYSTVSVVAFSGAAASPFDQESGAASSASPGVILPREDNCVFVTCQSQASSGTGASINGSFTASSVNHGGTFVGGGVAYKVQTTAGAENPTWSWSAGGTASVAMAVFKAAGTSGFQNYAIATQSGITQDNSIANVTTIGYPNVAQRGSFRFKATASKIRIWGYKTASSGQVMLFVDGSPASIQRATPQDTSMGWTSEWTVDGTTEHTYRVFIGSGGYCYGLGVDGTLNTTALTAFPADDWWGNSIVAASNITNNDAAPNFPQLYALQMDRGLQLTGTPGGTAYTQGQSQKAQFGATNPQCDRCFVEWGVNDLGVTSTPNFRTAVGAILDQMTTDEPTAKIYWFGVPRYSAHSATRAGQNTELADVISLRADADVVYLDSDNWDGGATISTSDGTHPDAAGAVQIADGLIAATSMAPTFNPAWARGSNAVFGVN